MVILLLSFHTICNQGLLVESRGTLHYDGFIEEMVASERAFTGAFVPNPTGPGTKPQMLLLSNKRGIVNVLTNPDESLETKEILNIEYALCSNGERGFQSIVPHPNFLENNYIYVFYTSIDNSPDCLEDPEFGPRNRLSRFKMDSQTLRIKNETEEILLEGAPTPKFYHNGGAIKFGNDGKLYVTTGDGGGDGPRTSQDLTNLHGALLRLNDDGSVPNDNPFTYQGGYEGFPCGQTGGTLPNDAPTNAVCSEIFSYGFRNPFRIIMDPFETGKTRFYVNDVGGSVWEEISEAGSDFPGKNYGWPQYEGPCKFGQREDCPLFDETSNVLNRESYVKPLYYYEHEQDREGGAVTGGAFVPEGIWPSQFKYIFADFIFHSIYNLVEAPEQECSTCLPPIPFYKNETFYTSEKDEDQHANHARVVDMFFGPYKDTQALYVFKMGGSDNVWRIRYTGSDNIPPVANIQVLKKTVNVGDIVTFNGSTSFDPEELDLQYQWDFGDTTESKSKEQNPIHIYSSPGQYTVRLAVTDSAEHTQSTSVVMVVGTPPALNITTPGEGSEFFVGEVITLSGVAYDSSGNKLTDDQISWEVRKHHADHFHPFLDVKTGNGIQLSPAPEPEDYLAATNSYLEIIMYATDSNGLISKTSRNVYPSLIGVCIDSEPQGLEIFVDEYPIKTPLQITSWVNHELRLRTTTQDEFKFSSWSDGIAIDDREMRLINGTNPGVVASFCNDGNNTCQTEAKSRAASDIYLIPRCQTDFPTSGPTELATDSPSAALTNATDEQKYQESLDDEEEEDWPVDISVTTDAEENEDSTPQDEEPDTKDDTVGERPVDDIMAIGEGDEELWIIFDEDEDDDNLIKGSGTYRITNSQLQTSVLATVCSMVLAVCVDRV